MKATAFAVVDVDGVVGFACRHCRDLIKAHKDNRTMTHPSKTGLFGRKPSICPFAGKVFKVPVFDLEEV